LLNTSLADTLLFFSLFTFKCIKKGFLGAAYRVFEIEDIESDVNAKMFWSEQKAQNFSTEFNLA